MKYFVFLLFLISVLLSCRTETLADLVDVYTSDKSLIQLSSYRSLDMYQVRVTFSKAPDFIKATLDGEMMKVKKETSFTYILTSPSLLSLSGDNELYIIAEDEDGNTSAFLLEVGGVNADIPELVINEFSARGSDTQPERIELEMRSDGNLEGVYLADGIGGNENWGFSLPDLDVKIGDYIVIHWNKQPSEKSYSNTSGTTTYNLYADSPTGLGDNNGVFVVKETKGGDSLVLDALVYSDFNATTYSGFGNAKVENSVQILKSSYDWFGEAVDCDKCTTTRTLNRWNGHGDTDTAADFFICDTKCQSFGSMNTSRQYTESAED